MYDFKKAEKPSPFDFSPRKKKDRNFLYNLYDNFVGVDDGVNSPGERLGKGVNDLAKGLASDPLGMAGRAVQGVNSDLHNLMFEGGSMQRPEDVLAYAAAPMAPGVTGARVANVLSANGFKNEMRGYHHGQADQTLRMLQDGEPVGRIDYTVYEGEPAIQMIEVDPKYRRQGHASDGLVELQKKYPDQEIDWGSLTKDGSGLYKSTDFVEVDQTGGINQILPEIEARAKAAEAAYLDTFKGGYSGDAVAVREAFYKLDDELETAREMAARPPKRFVNTAKPEAKPGIKAYHGSPHNFDKFSMDKIGTGEGAQAYGHGLYFAENEGVARGYRDALSRQVTKDGNSENPASYLKNPGSMYEVNINANPDDFLDWDAPLSAQSPKVRDALTGRLPPAGTNAYFDDNLLARPSKAGGQEYSANAGRFVQGIQGDEAGKMSSDLREAGIPGIKYRDAGSRGLDGDGTRNYVVFDENLINIVRKYGVAGAATMLGVGASDVQAAIDQGQQQ